MPKTRLFLIITVLFSIQVSKSQTGFSDWETAYFSLNATAAQKDFIKTVEFPRCISFPKIKPFRYGFDNIYCWNIFLKKYFAAYFTEAKYYSFNKTASLTYGILNLGNYDNFHFSLQLKSSINDTAWVENVYSALKPIIRQSWDLLDSDTRFVYVEILYHTKNFLDRFDYQEELRYQQMLSINSKSDEFIVHGYKSSEINEFRKAEAFVFRRINDSQVQKGNWTISWIRKMITDVMNELGIG
jgi:hypothetical protein